MSARPVLFNGAMVRAIIAGAKTQTRRLVKPQPPEGADPRWTWCVSSTNRDDVGAFHHGVIEPDGNSFTDRGRERQTAYRCPFGAPGDDLWVRETWAEHEPDDVQGTRTYYRADHADGEVQVRPGMFLRWTPSIHMPRWASRLTLRVTSVRVERLHAITEDDARAEGVLTVDGLLSAMTPRERFACLWREINGGRASWDANPWVWVVSFKRDEVFR